VNEAYAPAGLRACLAIAAELRAAAVDAISDLPMRERRALATLATTVEVRAGQRAGVNVDGASAEAAVAEALMALVDVRREAGSGSGEDA
jgi:hypothetical protein